MGGLNKMKQYTKYKPKNKSKFKSKARTTYKKKYHSEKTFWDKYQKFSIKHHIVHDILLVLLAVFLINAIAEPYNVIILFGSIIYWLIMALGYRYSCDTCYKLFSEKETSRKEIASWKERVNITRVKKHYDRNGNLRGTTEVPGSKLVTHKKFQVVKECKNCGNIREYVVEKKFG